jgi:hypothetical protein
VSAVMTALALLASTGALTGFWTSVMYADITPDRLQALEQNLPNIQAGFWIAAFLAGLTAGAWEGLARGAYGPRIALAALVLLATVDLYRVDRQFITTADPAMFFAADETVHYLQAAQEQEEPFRVWDIGAYSAAVLPIHGIELIAGHHGNELGRYRALIGGEQPHEHVAISELRLLQILNAPYIVSPQLLEVPGYEEVFRGSRSVVYRGPAMPRAFLVGQAEVVPDSLAVDYMLSPDFDFQNSIVVPEPLPAGVTVESGPEGGVVGLERGANRFRLRVTTDRPALLVVTDNYYPAWHAEVNGEPSPVLRANYTFRAVPVPAGEHDVFFEYRSPVLRASVAVSLVTLVLLLGVGVGGTLHHRRRDSPADAEDAASSAERRS